jgi:hypothetical protein
MANVTSGVIAELTYVSLPPYVSQRAELESLLSTAHTIGIKSSTVGRVVPIGSPMYVNGIAPTLQPISVAKVFARSTEMLIG